MPIDYRMDCDEMKSVLDQVNAVYMPGDSQRTLNSETYKHAFGKIMDYVETQVYEEKVHFPVFMMGNTLQTLVSMNQEGPGGLVKMAELKNENLQLEPSIHL